MNPLVLHPLNPFNPPGFYESPESLESHSPESNEFCVCITFVGDHISLQARPMNPIKSFVKLLNHLNHNESA